MKKRKVNFPVARTSRRPAPTVGLPGEAARTRSTVATINLMALDGRDDLTVGDTVRIAGGGLYSGEIATIETFAGGLIPAAVVRTESGATRRVRLVDVERVVVDRNPAERSDKPEE